MFALRFPKNQNFSFLPLRLPSDTLYVKHPLHVCPSRKKVPSSVAFPEVPPLMIEIDLVLPDLTHIFHKRQITVVNT